MRRRSVPVAILLTLAVGGRLLAHGGHAHRVIGTVTAVDPGHVEVKTAEGKAVSIVLGKDTKYLRGTKTAAASDVKVGDRIVVTLAAVGDTKTAREVRLSAAPSKAPR